jgi:hypothetical protein
VRPGANKKSLSEAAEKALLEILLGPQRNEKEYVVYNACPALFGLAGSTLRTQVRNRRTYLENIRVHKPTLFLKICHYHGLLLASTRPPTEAVEIAEADWDSSVTESMSSNRNHRRQHGKDKVIQALVPSQWSHTLLLLCPDDSDSSEDEDNRSLVVSPPRVNRRNQAPPAAAKQIILGDSVQNEFITLLYPKVPIMKDGKQLEVEMLELHYVVPFAFDWRLYRFVLSMQGHGLTFHYPSVPSLYTREKEDVQAMANSINAMLVHSKRAFVTTAERQDNLQGNFNFLKAAHAANPEVFIASKQFAIMSSSGESIRCTLDHFNTPNASNELHSTISTHETPIGTRPDGTTAKQQVYILTWNLCIARTARVIDESTPGNLNLLMDAISLNDAARGGFDHTMNGGD